ncbi:hypothetical protein [Tissierella sp. Yu-01]|uniref:hypothetical protein n=1 Tax=Tissierella sp. Yu-01 TaxID=3035694 RepID=UPI00240CF1AB|nr:hypothetical protein [Tissierella sp. Yu-01]WFA09449.1 hypothetical protein P3962_02535 [Tissierella sp. Yu-01]
MTFYNNKIIVAEISKDGIYIARKVQDNIQIEYIKENTKNFLKDIAVSEVIGDFDIDLDINKKINIIYSDRIDGLQLYRFKGNTMELIQIPHEVNSRLYEMNLINTEDTNNIFFMQPTIEKQIYRIYHHFLQNDVIKEFIVDDVKTFNIINPLRIIKYEKGLIIAYYYENQICTKIFDIDKSQWSPSLILTDNVNKLYLDIMFYEDRLHLVYSEYDNENFRIKYERFLFNKDYILKETEEYLSDNDNNVDPILIKVGSKLWVCWRNSNQIYSVFSTDNGIVWSDIYLWEDTKKMDLVKYKYITNIDDERVVIDYSYGSLKDIRFVGFDDIKKAKLYQQRK